MSTMPSQLMSPRMHDVGVVVGVGVAALVAVGVGVNVAVGCASNAPMSQRAPCGRGTFRSSVVTPTQLVALTASIAGLPGKRACVRLFPGVVTGGFGGFSCNGPSKGAGLMMSPAISVTQHEA